MKKTLDSLFNKLVEADGVDGVLLRNGEAVHVVSQDELLTVRGGDKEYKPIYEAPEKNQWQKPSMLFDLF